VNAVSAWMRSYWQWTTGGSKWRLASGVAGPVLAAVIVLSAVAGQEEPEAEQSVTEPTAISVVAPTTDPAPAGASSGEGAPTEVPTMTPTPVPAIYAVQPGDTLSANCQAQAPELPTDSCEGQHRAGRRGRPREPQVIWTKRCTSRQLEQSCGRQPDRRGTEVATTGCRRNQNRPCRQQFPASRRW
jgi:hypothetical protein